MTESIVFIVFAVEALGVLTCLLSLSGVVAFRNTRARRHAAAIHRAREVLRRVALAEGSADEAVEALRGLPFDLCLTVVDELAMSVHGQSLARLRAVAVAAGITREAERWLRSRRWWHRLRGLRVLAQLGADTGLSADMMNDPHPVVRAAAATTAVSDLSQQGAMRLLAMLEDPDAECRFAAKVALLRAGGRAAEAIREHLRSDRVPRPAAVLEVAVAIADPSFLEPALRFSTGDPATRKAATALLGRVAGEPATRRLLELLDDSDALVRATAARALGDLGHWPAAPALARALGDRVWEVRAAAATSLRRIGAPGRIYLREALRSTDAFAADIARQTLALPEGALSTAPG